MSMQHVADSHVSAKEFDSLAQALSTWGRWGEGDERGALNLLTGEHVRTAAQSVRDGVCVTVGLPLNTQATLDDPTPADHHMTLFGDARDTARPLHFAKDYIGVDYHNDGHTHIDALCHVAYHGQLYNGKSESAVTAQGAAAETINVLKDGLVGRGVLLDIPRLRGVPWLEPGEQIFRDELEEAEREEGAVVGEGDILLVRTGYTRRLAELGPWDTANAKAGLHPSAMSFVAQRGVAALGSDGNSDTAPSTTEGVAFPIHVLALYAMGVHLLDYLQLEDLRVACERVGRWAFLFVAAPLRIEGGTGSPINPIAMF